MIPFNRYEEKIHRSRVGKKLSNEETSEFIVQGFNPGTTRYDYFVVRMYTRVREDREKRKGSTPKKIKIPMVESWILPQLHPATDIPLSHASSIVPMFIGKPSYYMHDYEDQVGFIAHSNLTDNPIHLLEVDPEEETNCFKKKPIKFFTIMGILALEKDHIKRISKKNHGRGPEDLDCSIGYSFLWDIDNGDDVYDKEEWLDIYKTKVFATGFKPEECSVVDKGMGAVPGATFIQKLSKISRNKKPPWENMRMTKRLYDLVMRMNGRLKKLSSKNALELSKMQMDRKSKMERFFKQLGSFSKNSKKFFKVKLKRVELSQFANTKREIILENIKKFSIDKFKKKKNFEMSENIERDKNIENIENIDKKGKDGTEASQNPGSESTTNSFTPLKTTKTLSSNTPNIPNVPNIPNTPNVPNVESSSSIDERMLFDRELGLETEQDFIEFGKSFRDMMWSQQKKYASDAQKNIPEDTKKIAKALQFARNSKTEPKLSEDFQELYGKLAKNPNQMELHVTLMEIVKHTAEFTDKKKLDNQRSQEFERKNKRRPSGFGNNNTVDTVFRSFSKNTSNPAGSSNSSTSSTSLTLTLTEKEKRINPARKRLMQRFQKLSKNVGKFDIQKKLQQLRSKAVAPDQKKPESRFY